LEKNFNFLSLRIKKLRGRMGSFFFISFWIIDCKWLEEDEWVDWVDANVEPYLLIGENGDW